MLISPLTANRDHLIVDATDLWFGHIGNAGRIDDLCRGIDPSNQIRSTSPDIVVGCIIESQKGQFEGIYLRHPLFEMLTHRIACIFSTGTDRMIVRLFVAATG